MAQRVTEIEHGNNLQWVRPPLQNRSQKTLHALLDSAETLLRERPFGAVSVQDITKSAGSSVGAFYARFSDKMSVLHALHERYVAQATETAESVFNPERWQAMRLREVLSSLVGFLVEASESSIGIRRGVILAGHNVEAFRERRQQLSRATVAALAGLLQARRAELTVDDVDVAARFLDGLIFGQLDQRALVLEADREPAENLSKNLARAAFAYLTLG